MDRSYGPAPTNPSPAMPLDRHALASDPGLGYAISKRVVDVVLSAVGLVIAAPILVVAGIAIVATSGRPIVFRQQRIGRNLERFTMLKLRTMQVGNDDSAHRAYVSAMLAGDDLPAPGTTGLFKLDDDRVTPIGRRLREKSIDELPQLVNVLRGQMSLVGPRPALPWEQELFEPQMLVRFTVKPGITGLWQVSGRSRLAMTEALELDRAYVERRSIRLDLLILLRTLPAVLFHRDAA